MKKKLLHWQIADFIFVTLLGMLLHVLFNLSGKLLLVAPFCAVNESIWEHMKLLFYPMSLFAFIEWRPLSSSRQNFWQAKLAGILIGTSLIPISFYTFQGITGTSPEWFNIVIYFIAITAANLVTTKLLKEKGDLRKSPLVPLVILFLIVVVFAIFTFYPPHIPLFMDETTGTYGVGF